MIEFSKILAKKRDGVELTEDEIKLYIKAASTKSIHDTQIAAMLMAMYIRGLSTKETTALTRAMMQSGLVLKWEGLAVDKHSTGGIGDKISIPLAPALAALGLKVPMMSGTGLGLTGGTLDKLESIPGYRVSFSPAELQAIMEECGCFIVASTKDLCPGDKVTYEIRNATETVDCEGLIIASILSKKLAEGTQNLIMDMKVGPQMCFKTTEDAKKTATNMKNVAEMLGLKFTAIITEMTNPIGFCVGNSLEIIESVELLKKKHVSQDLLDIVALFGGELLKLSGKCETFEEGKQMILSVIKNGEALKMFHKMIINQGVDKKAADDLCYGDYTKIMPRSKNITRFQANRKGWVSGIDGVKIAEVCKQLGSGRNNPDDKIDYSVGAEIIKHIGFQVEENDDWIAIHHNQPLTKEMKSKIDSALIISDQKCQLKSRFIEQII